MSNATTAPDRAGPQRASAGRRFDRRRALLGGGAALLAPLLNACGAMPPSGPASPAPIAPGTPAPPTSPTA
ncbi:MAG TPA: hypothetical protein VFQ80_02095, partial [Thermomicrobiales bacterium]|nr:hypothetical protein [Thermomicrobiales bacterium]